MTAALVVGLALIVGLLAVLVGGLLRSHAEILRSLHDLGVNLDPDAAPADSSRGSGIVAATPGALGRAADLTGTTPSGGAMTVAVTGNGRRTLLAFLSSSCLTCRAFWDVFSEPEPPLPGARLVIVTKGADGESPSAIAELAPPHVTTLLSSQAWADYAVPGAPYFVLVDGTERRVIGEGAATTWRHVEGLLARAEADAAHAARQGGGAARESFVDDELRAAGILPGDPSLYPGRDAEDIPR